MVRARIDLDLVSKNDNSTAFRKQINSSKLRLLTSDEVQAMAIKVV
jgi:hypothetical protein